MIQKDTLLNLNIIITVIERRIGTGPKPETETIWIEKKKNVLANKTRRLVFKAAFTVPGMTGMRIQKVPRKRVGWPGTGKVWAAGEKPQHPGGKQAREAGASSLTGLGSGRSTHLKVR